MATKKKSKSKKAAPRKKITSERPLKNRPVDEPEAPETENEANGEATEGDEPTNEEEESLVTVETPRTRKGRQKRLPGTEDAEIEELESIAEEYVDIRDKRQRLTVNEVRLKGELLTEMKKNNKTTYNHGGCEISVIVEKEKVKVKFKKDDE